MATKADSRIIKREIEMDPSQLDDKIANIRSQLDKEIHDVIHMVQQKHVEFLPQTMFLPIQFAVEQVITKVNASVNELQGVAAEIERQLDDIKESPRKKLDSINVILSKLNLIKEFEDLYVEINSENMSQPVELANLIVKCQEYLKSLAGKEVYEPLKKVLPGLSHSFDFRKGDIVRQLNHRFLDMIHYPSTGGKSYLQLFVSRNEIEKFNMELDAMRILGLLDEQLEHFADETLNTFVARVLDSRAPHDNLIKFEAFPDNYSIVIKKNITKADKIDPLKIFEVLTTFFNHLHQCFEVFFVDKIPLVQYLGNKFSTKLTEMIIKDCLTASVPNDDTEKDAYQTVIETANKFHGTMQVCFNISNIFFLITTIFNF
uniref:Exocyst complex component Sec10 n=2 Tax=Panagrolaimus superbus TaxID=310955 RepID=A0A914Z278_9BILA